jgi:hypothetical protein
MKIVQIAWVPFHALLRKNCQQGGTCLNFLDTCFKLSSCTTANRSRTVGKRISRFPVESTVERKVKHRVSPTSLAMQDEEESDSHVVVAHTLVSRRTASPSVSNTPSRRSLRQVTAQQNGESKVCHSFCYPFGVGLHKIIPSRLQIFRNVLVIVCV